MRALRLGKLAVLPWVLPGAVRARALGAVGGPLCTATPSCASGSRRAVASSSSPAAERAPTEAGSQRSPAVAGAAGAAVLAAAGGLASWAAFGKVEEVNVKVEQISEEVFDTKDNLFVFFLDKSEDLLDKKDDLQKVCRALRRDKSLHRLTFYFNVRKEGDPPGPDGHRADGAESTGAPLLPCVMYKGQRKTAIKVNTADIPLDKITEFFAALSEKIDPAWKTWPVRRLSGQEFHEEVLEASSPAAPVLMQMYEDTCFLCFLMRPFVNSLAKLFKENGVPLTFKRINISENDFPDRCPVARGTPTFICFRGDKVPGVKWDEFKPNDLVQRLTKEYTNLPESVLAEMDELQGLVSRRFQMFTQLVMWTIELQKLEALLAAPPPALPVSSPVGEAEGGEADGAEMPAEAEEVDDDAFSSVVSTMMAADMRRTDLLLENLAYLQREVDEVEHDAALLGIMLAESVQKREKDEDELFAASRQKKSNR